MIDKDFQLFILQQAAPLFPSHAYSIRQTLLEHAPGDTDTERLESLKQNLQVLQELGYVRGAIQVSCMDELSLNEAFYITVTGLQQAEKGVVQLDPDQDFRDAFLEIAQALRTLSESQKLTLKNELSRQGSAALGRLLQKGEGEILAFLARLFS